MLAVGSQNETEARCVMFTRRDATDTALAVFCVGCFLAIATVVMAVHIGVVQF